MRNLIKAVAVLGVAASLGACAGETTDGDDVVYVPAPVTSDPVSTKY